jgi:cytochrome c553
MKIFYRIALFGLGIVIFYALFARLYIPAVEPEPPPAKVTLDLSRMSIDDFVAFGEMTYLIKGGCGRCHDQPGSRAPKLDQTAATAEKTIKLSTYGGNAKDAEGYLYESMVEPSRYVVPGYGVKGSNDAKSPMPEATGRVVGLGDAEVRAIAAYLQRRAGVEVTILPAGSTQKDKVIDESSPAR